MTLRIQFDRMRTKNTFQEKKKKTCRWNLFIKSTSKLSNSLNISFLCLDLGRGTRLRIRYLLIWGCFCRYDPSLHISIFWGHLENDMHIRLSKLLSPSSNKMNSKMTDGLVTWCENISILRNKNKKQ